MSEQDWEKRAAEKRSRLNALIPKELRLPEPAAVEDEQDVTKFDFAKYLEPLEMEITESKSVQAVIDKLQSGAWTSVQVTTAFLKRAVIAHQLTRCLTEIFWDRAIKRAQELDEAFKKNGPTGPLQCALQFPSTPEEADHLQRLCVSVPELANERISHIPPPAVPISLKDQLAVEGEELTMGYVGWIGQISDRNAVLVDLLLKQGAVIFVRTNIPQTLMIGESFNNVFGVTLNPRNRTLSPGGSSGGEGCLIAMRGSILGVGSDIGGSTRIPAAFNGLNSMRSCTNRFPYTGARNSCEGQEGVSSVFSPMSISVDGLTAFTRAVLAARPWDYDPLGVRMPWSDNEYKLVNHGGGKKLCFAILWDDKFVKPMPPYKRAMQITKDALQAAGHKVIDWEPYKHAEAWDILSEIWSADGGKDCNAARELSGEPPIQGVFTGTKEIGTYSFWQVLRRKLKYTKEYVDYWNATVSQTSTGRPVDAIIAPGNSNAPHPHFVGQSVMYTAICNLNDWATGVFPVTTVDQELDKKAPAHDFYNENDKAVYEAYDPAKYKNGPIGLQVIGRRYEEEAVLRMLEIVDEAVKTYKTANNVH